ncbi:MAG TPA: YfhO family protein, partial [Candidatus Binatia bacterium]|nr:YfhO family protein [Candidatus Binatia bacterium]
MPPAGIRGLRGELGLAVVFLALWILPPFWGIATLRTVNIQDDIYASDLWNDRLPTRAFVGASLRRGETPAWMPGIYTGFPSLAQVEVGALYPSNLLLFGLFDPYTAMAWAQILPLLIGGIGTYLLARELELPIESCLLAAGAFSLCGFLIAHLRQLNMVDAAAWVPLLLLAVERLALGRPGRAPLQLAVCWALQLLAGHPQISYFTALVLAVYFVARRWQERDRDTVARWPLGRALAGAVGAMAIGTLLAAAQIVPAAELSRLTYREGGLSLADATQYAASPLAVWTFFAPALFGDARDDSFQLSGIFWEQYGYLGVLPMLLAIVAIVAARRRRPVAVLAGLAVIGYLLFLGKNTPLFAWAFAVVPGMRYFRFPTRFLLFVELALALLAGFGLAALLEKLAGTRRLLAAGAVIVATAADLWVHQVRQVPQVERERWLSPIGTERFLSSERSRGGEPWRYYT